MTTQTIDQSISDAPIRTACLDTTSSFIVSAPAGSGKTTLLINRFLACLGQVDDIKHIMAMTFTRKAAIEMRLRLSAAITAAHKPSQNPAAISAADQTTHQLAMRAIKRHEHLAWSLEHDPNALNIMTIDAFCQKIVDQGHPTHLKATDDPLWLYQKAIDALYTHCSDDADAPIHALIKHANLDHDRLHDWLCTMLANREQWLGHAIHITQHGKHFKNTQIKSFDDHIAQLQSTWQDYLGSDFTHELDTWVQSVMPHLHEPFDRIKQACHWMTTQQDTWRKTLTSQLGTWTKNKTDKNKCLELINSASSRPFALALCLSIKKLPQGCHSMQGFEWLKRVCRCLLDLAAHFDLICQEHHSCDFASIAMQAFAKLNTNPLDPQTMTLINTIRHCMVDEFQDTSRPQFNMLEAICNIWQDNPLVRSVLLVGDPMQSIYGFRQADCQLFEHATQHGIGHMKLQAMALTQNFRAHGDLIAWQNHHLARAFAQVDDQHGPSFYPSVSLQPPAGKRAVNYLWHTQDDTHAQYGSLLSMIQKNRQEKSGQTHAILARTRRQLIDCHAYLIRHGMACQAESWVALADYPIIIDLCSLLKLLTCSHDKLSCLAWLRSPFVGLNFDDVLIIAQHQHDAVFIPYPTLKETLNDQAYKRYTWACHIMQGILAHRSSLSVPALLKFAFEAFHGPEHINPQDQPFIDAFWEKLQQRHDDMQTHFSAHDFIQQLANHHASLMSDDQDAVIIMTIHQAKGLEFDHVYLPCLNKANRISHSALLQTSASTTPGVTWVAAHQYNYQDDHDWMAFIERRNANKQIQEMARLFYVACTRAKISLSLFAYRPDHRKPAAKSLLTLIDTDDDRYANVTVIDHAPNAHQDKKNSKNADQIQYILPYHALKSLEIPTPKSMPDLPQPDAHEHHFGKLVHALMMHLSYLDAKIWLVHHDKLCDMIITKHQSCYANIDPQSAKRDFDTLRSLAHRLIQDPRARWILRTDHIAAASEMLISSINDHGLYQHHIIDRSFIADQKRWIIDYKTSPIHDAQSAMEYAGEQLQTYANAMSRQNQDFKIMLGIYQPLTGFWHAFSHDQ